MRTCAFARQAQLTTDRQEFLCGVNGDLDHKLAPRSSLRPRRADHRLHSPDRRPHRQHDRRKEKIYKLIAEQPRNAYELAQAIWGNVAVTQTFLTLSEVIGHADLLVNEGRMREADEGQVIGYEAVE